MELKINGVEIAAYPRRFEVTTLDLDDADTSVRTADGTLYRDRVRVIRKITMEWNALKWSEISAVLQSMQDVSFDVRYPDPFSGQYETRSFYAGDRPAPYAITHNGVMMWAGLKVTLTEN